MAFTVGLTGNSYADQVYADAYFADRGSVTWTGNDSAKQAALIRASDYINAFFAPYFNPVLFLPGIGWFTLQRIRSLLAAQLETALQLIENNGGVIPDLLARATCEYAVLELTTPGCLAPPPKVDDSGFNVVTTSRKVGPLSRTFQAVGASTKGPGRRRFPVADSLMAQLLVQSGNMVIR